MPTNNIGTISKVWTFESSSSDTQHEAVQYVHGATSCSCNGWTRRVAPDGSRSCKHTRMIEQGVADKTCLSCKEYAPLGSAADAPAQSTPVSMPAPVKPEKPLMGKPDSPAGKVKSRFQRIER